MSPKLKPVIFRNFDFLRLWLGQILSQSGTRMYQIAVVWWLVTSLRADSGKAAALFLVLCALPGVLFLKGIGRLVDTYRTRHVLLAADGVNALVVLSLSVILYRWPNVHVGVVYLCGFLISLLQAVTDPTLTKAVPEVVASEDIESATAFQASTISLGYYIGAGTGAFLIAALHTPGVIAVNGLTYLGSFLLVLMSRFKYAPPPRPPATAEAMSLSAWKYLEQKPLFKKLLIGMGFANFFCVPTFLILPMYVSRALHAEASTLAWIESGLWLGILFGTFLSRKVRFTEDPEQLGAICAVVLAIGLFVPGLIVSVPVYFAMIFLQGLAFSFMPVRFIPLFHQGVPPEMKGRFFALMGSILTVAQPISHFAAGALADVMPVTNLCLIQGVGTLLVTAYFLAPRAASKPGPLTVGTDRG